MPKLYFPKPQPLSPHTKVQIDEKGRYLIRKGKKVRINGTWTADSIYYLWFEYLKRSEKYKKACANNGKGMQKIYDDFGNIFEYEGLKGFWLWWNERGQYLFGVSPASEMSDFISFDEVLNIKNDIENGSYKLLAIPTNLTKTTIKKRFNRLLSEVKLNPKATHNAKYEVKHVKVDADSLKTCLLAYDLRQKGIDVIDIAMRVKSVYPHEVNDLKTDGRTLARQVDLEALAELSEKNTAEYDRRLAEAKERVAKRLKRQGLDFSEVNDYDDLLDKEMGLLKINYVRTSRKRSLRTNTYKLIHKAEANIVAVERGEFAIGH